jgi:hypothetical protein
MRPFHRVDFASFAGLKIGRWDMGFFTKRERDALGKLPQANTGAPEFAYSRREVFEEGRRPVEGDPRFANREAHALNNPRPSSDESPEFVRTRRDVQPERGPKEIDPASLLRNASHAQVREIDTLIADLKTMRETLNSEASRVQRAMIEYTTFSETALQSSKVICESLRTGLRPFQDKRQKEKGSSRARRKARRRLARQMKLGNTGTDATTRGSQARPA